MIRWIKYIMLLVFVTQANINANALGRCNKQCDSVNISFGIRDMNDEWFQANNINVYHNKELIISVLQKKAGSINITIPYAVYNNHRDDLTLEIQHKYHKEQNVKFSFTSNLFDICKGLCTPEVIQVTPELSRQHSGTNKVFTGNDFNKMAH